MAALRTRRDALAAVRAIEDCFHGVTAATIAAGIRAMTHVASMSLNENAF
jgi:hypothetical protein